MPLAHERRYSSNSSEKLRIQRRIQNRPAQQCLSTKNRTELSHEPEPVLAILIRLAGLEVLARIRAYARMTVALGSVLESQVQSPQEIPPIPLVVPSHASDETDAIRDRPGPRRRPQ